MGEKKRRRIFSLLFLLFFVAACSERALDLFFDIPPKSPAEKAASEASKKEASAARETAGDAAARDTDVVEVEDRPAIEETLVWAEAEAMLPKDDLDLVDWMAAFRSGVIKPRTAIGGNSRNPPAVFGFDFYLPGPDPSFNAFFPHSTHTEWLDCKSCHPAIFPIRGTPITMDDIFEGKYCGACHGVVAFELDSCTRCHTAMEE